ncbi:MAG: hypothetical protein GX974_06670 [Clostridiales bacterium]|nr:hypothetical protein [Clostridiales bacterium]
MITGVIGDIKNIFNPSKTIKDKIIKININKKSRQDCKVKNESKKTRNLSDMPTAIN